MQGHILCDEQIYRRSKRHFETKEGKRIGSANQNKLMINLSVYSKSNQVDSVNGTLIETKEC